MDTDFAINVVVKMHDVIVHRHTMDFGIMNSIKATLVTLGNSRLLPDIPDYHVEISSYTSYISKRIQSQVADVYIFVTDIIINICLIFVY